MFCNAVRNQNKKFHNRLIILFILLAEIESFSVADKETSKHSVNSDQLTQEETAPFENSHILLKLNNTIINAEIADTLTSKKNGLKFRKEIDKNGGVLFIFPEPKRLAFWMKDTQIPLSIAFINENRIITQIEKMAPFSLKSVSSKHICIFALEVNQGFFEKHNIKRGDKIYFL